MVIIKGAASRVNNYTTQTITFPAGSSAPVTLNVDITDNDDCDYNTSIVFELQNVSGGLNAGIEGQETFSLNITDDNTTSENDVMDDFEDADFSDWLGEPTLFEIANTGILGGSTTLFTDTLDGDSVAYVVLQNNITDLKGTATTWRFSVATGQRDPNDKNRFTVFLSSNGDNPLDAGIQGYAVAVNEGGNTDDRLRLYRIDDSSSATELIKYEVPAGWGSFDKMAVEVTRDEAGNWEMFVNDDADFSALIPADAVNMPVLDATYDVMGSTIVVSHQNEDDWALYFDDLSVTQEFCSGAYETTGSGNSSGGIWQLVGTSTPATPPFNKYTEIIVQNGDVLTLDSDIRTGKVTVQSGGELSLGADHELEIFEDLTIDGTLTSNKGAVSFNGNQGAQSIGGTAVADFYELNGDNADGLIFNQGANFYGPIHAENGTIDFIGQNVVLASDDIGGEILTGSISEIKTGADVLGEITIERYVENIEDGYRLIGMPVTGQTINSAFNGDFATLGFPGADYPAHELTNLKYYDETDPSCDLNEGFIDVTNSTDAVDPHKGYWAYFPDNTSNYVLDVTGAFNKGDITINLDYTAGCDAQEIGWNCIVNPYPSAIDITSTEIDFVNCDADVYILDHTLGFTWKGEYVSYVNGVSVNGGSNILSSYQAFFVKATGPGASITFKEGCKVDDQAGFLRFDDVSRELIRLSVNSETNKYETVVSFHDHATAEFDPEFDGYFLESNSLEDGALTLASLVGENTLSVNTLNELTEPLSVTLRTITPTAGDYWLSLDALQNISQSACLVIEDTETGTVYSVEPGVEIPFTADEDLYQTDRFVLHAYPGADYVSYMTSCSGTEDGEIELVTPGYADWNTTWYDADNNILMTSSSEETILTDLSAGVYRVEMESEGGHCTAITQEIVVMEPALEVLTVNSINAVCSEESAQVFTQLENANSYDITLFQDGQVVAESTGTGNLAIGELAGEVYTLQVISACTTEEVTLDLKDENQVEASFFAQEEVILTSAIGQFDAVNTSTNALYSDWFVNGELVSQGENLYYEFTTPGEYEVKLEAANQYCSSEASAVVIVSMADNISENEIEFDVFYNGLGLVVNTTDLVADNFIEIYDVKGQLVQSERLNAAQSLVVLDDISVGVYTARIINSNESLYTTKFVK